MRVIIDARFEPTMKMMIYEDDQLTWWLASP